MMYRFLRCARRYDLDSVEWLEAVGTQLFDHIAKIPKVIHVLCSAAATHSLTRSRTVARTCTARAYVFRSMAAAARGLSQTSSSG